MDGFTQTFEWSENGISKKVVTEGAFLDDLVIDGKAQVQLYVVVAEAIAQTYQPFDVIPDNWTLIATLPAWDIVQRRKIASLKKVQSTLTLAKDLVIS